MSRIELINIDKYYGSNHVLKNVSLDIKDGAFMTLLGPSGCGKTTMLRVIAGLERPQGGFMLIDGKQAVNAREHFFLPPKERGLNLVFQSYALWPHMTVYENVAFALKVEKRPSKEIDKAVKDALERMQIGEFAKRYPSELSGGQQQRVAIARSIASVPKILLLDEPLSNLDAILRIDMRSEIKRLHKEMGTTIVYVTHDQVEALTMSTEIAVFFKGVIEQVAAPITLYQNPASLKVAGFVGNPRINFIKGISRLCEDGLALSSPLGDMLLAKDRLSAAVQQGERTCQIGIRPEQIVLSQEAKEGFIPAKVYACMPAGSETLVQLVIEGQSLLVKQLGLKNFESDATVYVGIEPQYINVFDVQSEELIAVSDVYHAQGA